eukprot:SAG25_NODE_11222_length_310_cov_0.976303_2_plen_22_part_01
MSEPRDPLVHAKQLANDDQDSV